MIDYTTCPECDVDYKVVWDKDDVEILYRLKCPNPDCTHVIIHAVRCGLPQIEITQREGIYGAERKPTKFWSNCFG